MPVDKIELGRRLQTEYALFAQDPADGEHGLARALRLRYPRRWLSRLPPWMVESFAGTGNLWGAKIPSVSEQVKQRATRTRDVGHRARGEQRSAPPAAGQPEEVAQWESRGPGCGEAGHRCSGSLLPQHAPQVSQVNQLSPTMGD